MNTEIIALENKLVNVLNDSNLPIEVKRLVLAEIMVKVTEARAEAIRAEQQSKEQPNGKEDKPSDESI